MVAYWPGTEGAAYTLRWDAAALLAVIWFFGPRGQMTFAHWVGLVLAGWLALSLLWSEGPLDGGNEAFQFAVAAVAFAVGARSGDAKPLILGCALGIVVNSAILVSQYQGWIDIGSAYGVPAGLFFNQDRLAAAAAMVALGCVGHRSLWPLLPLLAPCVVMPHSSAAWLALAAGLFVLANELPHRLSRVVRALMIVAACAAIAVKLGTASTDDRIGIWRDTIMQLNVFGHGLGSFYESFFSHATVYMFPRIDDVPVRPSHPHNEWLWLAFEGGVPAVVLGYGFAGAIISTAKHHPLRGVLAGFFVLALFAMPFHDPATAVLAALVAGHCAGCGARDGRSAITRGILVHGGLAADGDQAEREPLGIGA